jgi:diguanylate cyclase (GGDEF) domain
MAKISRTNAITILRSIMLIALIVLIGVMMYDINDIQGDAKLINYAGIVRGGSQMVVKDEFAGHHSDKMIKEIDGILEGMRTGGGQYNFKVLKDDDFQGHLYTETAQWNALKKIVYAYRKDASKKTELYNNSEQFFDTANATVKAAENSSNDKADALKAIEFLILIMLILLVSSYLGRGRQMVTLIKKNRKLDRMAYIDQGTGLPNARRCLERLSDERPIEPGVSITCYMFDLNNLKETNDEYGHEEGNLLLARFASCLKRSTTDHTFVGRFGGDEFIAVAVGLNAEQAYDFLDRLDQNVEKSNAESKIKISFARGLAMSLDHPGLNIRSLMDAADKAMYQDKMTQKSSVGDY